MKRGFVPALQFRLTSRFRIALELVFDLDGSACHLDWLDPEVALLDGDFAAVRRVDTRRPETSRFAFSRMVKRPVTPPSIRSCRLYGRRRKRNTWERCDIAAPPVRYFAFLPLFVARLRGRY